MYFLLKILIYYIFMHTYKFFKKKFNMNKIIKKIIIKCKDKYTSYYFNIISLNKFKRYKL